MVSEVEINSGMVLKPKTFDIYYNNHVVYG
jgi:hypothetical protein